MQMSDRSKICLCCKERTNTDNMEFFADEIGICKTCAKGLYPVSSVLPFEGTQSIECVFSPFYYRGMIKTLIQRYKFHREWKISELFAKIIFEYIKHSDILESIDFITAIPLDYKRLKERGFNQSHLMAQALCELLKIPYVDCVYRHKHTLRQSTLSRFDRRTNTRNAFLADDQKVRGMRILLVDDIFTTGATMNSCAEELKNKGAKSVIGLALAIRKHKS